MPTSTEVGRDSLPAVIAGCESVVRDLEKTAAILTERLDGYFGPVPQAATPENPRGCDGTLLGACLRLRTDLGNVWQLLDAQFRRIDEMPQGQPAATRGR